MKAKKSLGQNFLRDEQVLVEIIVAAQIKKEDVVLEVGPGEGVLTRTLLEAGANVIAVEKDERLIADLETKFPNAKIAHADILNYPLLITHYKIVSNIPYYITGKFLRKIFSERNLPERVVLLLQKEVAERVVAKDGKESILSISVKAYGTPSIVRYVDRNAFEPAPNIDSAVLLIENISRKFFAKIDEKRFFDLVRKGFAHKRKKLGGNLGIEDSRRAEELTLEDWKKIYEELDK